MTASTEVDLLAFAASSSHSSPAVLRKPSDAVKAADSGSEGDDDDSSEL